ncbi:hypothetical protein EBB07_27335 [Paenibacillaceae bacterium]|nr:hypothetical protein EBB07_27335 [Paenibacillaceae bacterium]
MAGSWTTYLGAAHGVLSAAKLTDLSLMEMAGMTGMAFHLYMHKHCDAAAVTVYDWVGRHQSALDRIGVLSETYHYEPGSRTYEPAKKRAAFNIKNAIDQGTGVVAWAIDTGEFGIIYGYDDEDGVFLVDGVDRFNRPLGSDPMLYENIGMKFPPAPFVHYQIPLASVAFNREQTYIDSLTFYVHEMKKGYHMSPDFQSGFLAYDIWVHSLKNDTYNPFGLRYCTIVYAEAKCFAAEYMQYLAADWGGLKGMHDVAGNFKQVAVIYRSMMDALEQSWDGGGDLGKKVTTDQAKQLIPYLQQAKELEYEAVKQLEENKEIK